MPCLSTTIDKYCYISVRELPPFFDHKFRVVYSIVENVQEIGQIQHPAVRGVLEWLKVGKGLEIHHDGDLPARSGLGSSSAFTVGLINAVHALEGGYIVEGHARERGHSRRTVRAARARRAAGSGLDGVRRLQSHRRCAERRLHREPDGAAPHSASRRCRTTCCSCSPAFRASRPEVAETVVDNMKQTAGSLHEMRQMVDHGDRHSVVAIRGPGGIRRGC